MMAAREGQTNIVERFIRRNANIEAATRQLFLFDIKVMD